MSVLAGPLRPGDRAPDFTLPPANREGPISLADYRGQQAVLVGLFRGIECPFCRRQIVQLGLMHIEGLDLTWKQMRFPTEAELLTASRMVTS